MQKLDLKEAKANLVKILARMVVTQTACIATHKEKLSVGRSPMTSSKSHTRIGFMKNLPLTHHDFNTLNSKEINVMFYRENSK